MSDKLLHREDSSGIATLTLNSPNSLNALSNRMLDCLQKELDTLKEDKQIRVIIIKGAGKAFCAGHDLKEMTLSRQAKDGGKAAFKALFDKCAKMMQTIPALPQPVIAQVHGIATAAGCQLVASSDLAVAAEDTKFGVNGVNIGLFCSTPMVALSRNIPRKKVFEMLTTGEFINSEKAYSLGLVNRIAPLEDLTIETLKLAKTIESKLGSAVKIGKEAFYKQIMMPLDQAYEYTGEVMVKNMLDRDTEEGVLAFIEKRDPTWEQ
jgi:enoyl-CoA hydratase/carnithine racemase